MLTEPQKNWLAQLNGNIVRQQALDQRESQKLALLAKLAKDREAHKEELSKAMGQKVTTRPSKKMVQEGRGVEGKGDDMDVRHKKGDQTKSFDIDDQRDGFRLAASDGTIEEWDPNTGNQEKFQEHLAAAREIEAMADEMERAMTDEIGPDGKPTGKQVPLFSKEDIVNELYAPLQRRGLLAETFVPDKYSQTKEMLDETYKAYAERLKSDKKSKARQMFNENLGLGKSLLNFSVTTVSSGLTINSAANSTSSMQTKWDPQENIKSLRENLGLQANSTGQWASDVDKTSQAMQFIGQGLNFASDQILDPALTIEGKVLEDRGLDNERNTAAAMQKLVPALVGAAAMSFGNAMNASGLGMEASATFGSKVQRGNIATALGAKKLDASHMTQIATELAKAMADVLLELDPGITTTVPTSKDALTGAADVLKREIPAALAAAKALSAVQGDRPDEAVTLFGEAAAAGASAALKKPVLDVFASPAARQKARANASDAMTAEFEADVPGPVPPKQVAKHKTEHSDHLPDWVQGAKGEWVCAVCESGNTQDAEVFAGMLDRRIAQLDRDMAIMKWGSNLLSLGIDTATTFIAPLAIAGCAVKMAKNLYEAAKRTADTASFCEKREGMFNAASAYSAPVSNFIYNGGLQAAHYYANAAFEAAKMIGAIIQCAGAVAAPAGAIVTAAAGAGQALEQVLYEAKKRYDLEKAWDTYKLAISRPQNRRLGLIAMKKNPTLAKYAVAWGAVIKQDPLVVDFMAACDLNASTLKDPKANLDRVVSYLEKRMPDDNVVTGRDLGSGGPVPGWAPAKIELKAASWLAAKTRAIEQGKVVDRDTRTLELALIDLEREFAKWELAAAAKPDSKLTQDQKLKCEALLDTIDDQLARYPVKTRDDAGGNDSMDMLNLLGEFRRLVEDRSTTVAQWAVAP